MSDEEDFISEEEFHDFYGAYTRPSGDLFQFPDIRAQPIEHVWTIVESGSDEDRNWYALPGCHVVNMLGYVLTKHPWPDFTRDAIYFLDDIFDDKDRRQSESEEE